MIAQAEMYRQSKLNAAFKTNHSKLTQEGLSRAEMALLYCQLLCTYES